MGHLLLVEFFKRGFALGMKEDVEEFHHPIGLV